MLSRLTFEAFEDKFISATWEADDPALRSLAAAVDLKIAEFTNGHLSMRDLKRSLARLNAGTGGLGIVAVPQFAGSLDEGAFEHPLVPVSGRESLLAC